jgi:hypothetical protein
MELIRPERRAVRTENSILAMKSPFSELYKSSIMRHTSASLSWRIFYFAMFDHNMEINKRRGRK